MNAIFKGTIDGGLLLDNIEAFSLSGSAVGFDSSGLRIKRRENGRNYSKRVLIPKGQFILT